MADSARAKAVVREAGTAHSGKADDRSITGAYGTNFSFIKTVFGHPETNIQ